MKLFYTQNSPYARRARLAARFSGLPVEEVGLGSMREGGGEVLKQYGPGAKVPGLLTDSGVYLTETLIITGYLCEKSGGRLMSFDERLLELEGLGQVLTDALYVRNMERQKTDCPPSVAIVGKETDRIMRCYDALNERLSGKPADMNLATFSAVAALGYADWRGADDNWRGGREGLAVWFDAMMQDKDVAETAPVF
ncbi:glutathione S-transferase family protein [Minwuia sp.]|uniref:glutathione S-transferase family protein n=1 Tax=Minwuia sp. TaxID=2493630 RepID=UPI003A923F24